ncbi:hypothetical protein CLV90_2957 [Maribacter spongiicola]|uniref:MORN repeat protein n=1 Tax=Maribacter spongiicola TaxID=1206753 RepID=A0A4R7K1P6_9FLAO|nr:hypothetical protein [Maribacter spongiicola]TDT43833.1 hypothetical protein CLV90_2957 [Maribacter spongiicola]
MNIKPKLIYTLLALIVFSCQEKEKIMSSYSLNKADGLYKLKEEPFTGKVLDTTNSGRVILTFNCIKGKLNGKYLEYYAENGNLKQKSTYENGNKTGPYLNLKKNGDTITYGNFLNYKKMVFGKNFTVMVIYNLQDYIKIICKMANGNIITTVVKLKLLESTKMVINQDWEQQIYQ